MLRPHPFFPFSKGEGTVQQFINMLLVLSHHLFDIVHQNFLRFIKHFNKQGKSVDGPAFGGIGLGLTRYSRTYYHFCSTPYN